MPPKNKKQLQQEARRLQQERLKRQEEERRLQEQRKKYAAQKLSTELILPVSNQLVTQFVLKDSHFINQKLGQVLAKQYIDLRDEKTIKQIIKQMFYHIKNLRKLFSLGKQSIFEQNKQKYLKIRVCCGMFLALYLHNHRSLNEQSQKIRQSDEKLLRQLVLSHGQQKAQGQLKVFDKKDIIEVLNYFKQQYFDHFLILHRSTVFPKREDQKSFRLYIATPMVQFNTASTKFIDLSGQLDSSKQKKATQ